jgi:beta-phosphoglucomutase-like phosphatase (HAD superfamily)
MFEFVVSSDEVGRGKPAPDIYLETARRLGVPPAACAVFEDSAAGIESGAAAGMKVIAVPNNHLPPAQDALEKAHLVLESLVQFRPAMLERLAR